MEVINTTRQCGDFTFHRVASPIGVASEVLNPNRQRDRVSSPRNTRPGRQVRTNHSPSPLHVSPVSLRVGGPVHAPSCRLSTGEPRQIRICNLNLRGVTTHTRRDSQLNYSSRIFVCLGKKGGVPRKYKSFQTDCRNFRDEDGSLVFVVVLPRRRETFVSRVREGLTHPRPRRNGVKV